MNTNNTALNLLTISIILFALLFTLMPAISSAEELQVYSSRNASYLTPLFNEYSHETGISVGYVVASAEELIKRLEVEDEQNVADILLTTGPVNLWRASQKGLLQPVNSKRLLRTVPKHLRSPEHEWFAFSLRAQAIAYDPNSISTESLNDYADLAKPEWKGKLCLRTSNSEYAQSLVGSLSYHHGDEQAFEILKGWVRNLAQGPMIDDLAVLSAIDQKACAVGIINSYYLPRHYATNKNSSIKLHWVKQNGSGVHADITGAGVLANAKNKALAIDFLEWLLSRKAQALYAKISMEYPINVKVYPAYEMAKHGTFKEDKTDISHLAMQQGKASQLIRKSKYR